MVEVERVSKRFGRQCALEALSLRVAPGEIVALLGPNGAGKSTLLKALVGLVRPDEGQIRVGGFDVFRQRREALRLIGFVPQRVGFPGAMRVQEVLRFHAELKDLEPGAVPRALERVGLSEAAARRVQELSGGMLQRLGLAQALLAEPPLLILDEPTVGLDPQVSLGFRSLLAELNRQGVTVVLSSHLLGETEHLASRLAILKQGALVAEGSLEALMARSGSPVVLWLRPRGEASASCQVLIAAGFACEATGASLRVEVGADGGLGALEALRRAEREPLALWTSGPSLEEVFRRIVEAP